MVIVTYRQYWIREKIIRNVKFFSWRRVGKMGLPRK